MGSDLEEQGPPGGWLSPGKPAHSSACEDGFADAWQVTKGAYILKDCDGTPAVILIGTGSGAVCR